jgi:hypothetical protein
MATVRRVVHARAARTSGSPSDEGVASDQGRPGRPTSTFGWRFTGSRGGALARSRGGRASRLGRETRVLTADKGLFTTILSNTYLEPIEEDQRNPLVGPLRVERLRGIEAG